MMFKFGARCLQGELEILENLLRLCRQVTLADNFAAWSVGINAADIDSFGVGGDDDRRSKGGILYQGVGVEVLDFCHGEFERQL